jgi:superfamily II DNA or RNA helicase
MMTILNYPDEYKDNLSVKSISTPDKEKLLRYEQNLIRSYPEKTSFIVNYTLNLTGNTIVFFLDIKHGYGKRLYDAFKEKTSSCEVYYIDGDVSEDLRTIYKESMEELGGIRKILVASYDTFGTGKNVHNIHHIVCAEARKSPISVGQFIGRGMRKAAGKILCTIHDFVDNISNDDFTNYMMKWVKVRRKLYSEDGLKCTVQKVNLTNKDISL